MTKRRFAYLVIALVVLSVFSPALHSGICSSDDGDLLNMLSGIRDFDVFREFFGNRNTGIYYRPLVYSTFVLDKLLWDASPFAMHLGNLLIHLVNTILVFEFTKKIRHLQGRATSHIPLLAALFFGLHPLTVETVAWISGRYDGLCATFVFASAIALLKFKEKGHYRYLIIAAFMLCLGFFAKEIALAFLPGAVLILFAKRAGAKSVRLGWQSIVLRASLVLGCASGVFVGYLILRNMVFSAHSSRIGLTLQIIFNDLYYALFVMLRAFGFYIKKIFIPYPLNFAIVLVDPLYELLAIPLVFFCVWLLTRREIVSSVFLAGLGLFTPAFLIAFEQIAWAAYAERYLYATLGFVVPAVVCYVSDKTVDWERGKKKIALALTLVLLFGIGGTVFQRATLWQSNLSLFADTTEKSPLFKSGWNQFGVALYENGELEKALEAFEKASRLNSSVAYKSVYDVNKGGILERLGRDDEAIEVLRGVVRKKRVEKRDAYSALIDLLERKIATVSDAEKREQLRVEIDDYKKHVESQ